MKQKIALLMMVMIIAKSNFAQKTAIGFSAGVTIASMHVKAFDISTTTNSKTGMTAGIYAITPIGLNFIFLPAINFVQKGAIPKDLQPGEHEKITLNYIEVPLNFGFRTHGFMVGAGPSVALGISGHDKYSSDTQPEEKTQVKWGNSEEDDIRRLDAGANFFTGYQFPNGFMIAANYNLGLANLTPGSSNTDIKATNRYFGFRLAYTFKD